VGTGGAVEFDPEVAIDSSVTLCTRQRRSVYIGDAVKSSEEDEAMQ
jgi:hypothetical protein